MKKGLIFDIQKFSIHDGPGIRTTVFLKGCPLHCLWCHNPESQKGVPEIFFTLDKCIGCGWCFKVCPEHCHAMENEVHTFHRERCRRCGKCTEECYAGSLETAGKKMSVREVLDEVLKDKVFYENSGGGMTLSGGEPMHQFPFTLELAKAGKKAGLHVAVETCGLAPWSDFETLLPYVDLFLFDLKATDPGKHKALTGVGNQLILENLKKLDEAGASIVLCCPLVPGVNDDEEHLAEIAGWANRLKNVREIVLHPYHPLGVSKCGRLGISSPLDLKEFAPDETVRRWRETISGATRIKVT